MLPCLAADSPAPENAPRCLPCQAINLKLKRKLNTSTSGKNPTNPKTPTTRIIMLKQLPPTTKPTFEQLKACGDYAFYLKEAKASEAKADKCKAIALETVRLHGTQTTPHGRLILTKSTTAKVPTLEQWQARTNAARLKFDDALTMFIEEFITIREHGEALSTWVDKFETLLSGESDESGKPKGELMTFENCPGSFAEHLETQYGTYLLKAAADLAELEQFTAFVRSYHELTEWTASTKTTFDSVGVTLKTETPTIKLVALNPIPAVPAKPRKKKGAASHE
jgi:hypothetical protein